MATYQKKSEISPKANAPPDEADAAAGQAEEAVEEEEEEQIPQDETAEEQQEFYEDEENDNTGGGNQNENEGEKTASQPEALAEGAVNMAKGWASKATERIAEGLNIAQTNTPNDESEVAYLFNPIDFDWQLEASQTLKLNVRQPHHPRQFGVPLTHPREVTRTQADGNCFFRALSVAITGSSADHLEVRQYLIEYMRHPVAAAALLELHDYKSTYQYIQATKMDEAGTWATDTEILASASMLKTDIYIYAKEGQDMKWHKFPANVVIRHVTPKPRSIYMCHTFGCHYDYVTAVATPGVSLVVDAKEDISVSLERSLEKKMSVKQSTESTDRSSRLPSRVPSESKQSEKKHGQLENKKKQSEKKSAH